MVILQRAKGFSKAGAIERRLSIMMDSWENSKFDMLVQDIEHTALVQFAHVCGVTTPE
jgi:hypothetical protein